MSERMGESKGLHVLIYMGLVAGIIGLICSSLALYSLRASLHAAEQECASFGAMTKHHVEFVKRSWAAGSCRVILPDGTAVPLTVSNGQ